MNIFLLDDDPVFCQVVAATFTKHHITTFHEESDCLNALQLRQPDVLIMDYFLGRKVGLETFKKISDLYPTLRIIVISGSENGQDVLKFIQAGVKDYLVKNDDVIPTLKSLL